MGVKRAPKTITDADIPELIARDTETAAAITNHVAGNSHPQYLLKRLKALLTQGILGSIPNIAGGDGTIFDANTWNPNLGQAHESAINVAAIGTGNRANNVNLPINSTPGLIVEIDPFLGTPYAALGKTQLFLYYPTSSDAPYSLWIRQQAFSNSWYPWQQISIGGAFASFNNGIRVGINGTIVKKLISQEFTIDPVAVVGQSVTGINLTVAGATVGDIVYVSPIGPDLWNTAIWPFEWPAVVSGTNNVALYLRNDWSGTIDLDPLKIRVVVMGF